MKSRLCVVFDIDDTLYLECDYVRSGFAAVGLWAGHWLDERFAELCQQCFDAGQRGSIFDTVLQTIGSQPNQELIASLVELYRTHAPKIELLPDAHDALTDLYAHDVPLAIVSDGPATSQSRKADALGLSRFARLIVLTGLRGEAFAKPNPWGFEQVEAAIPAESYLYVGDNPRKDFIAPQQLGWLTARIRRLEGLHAALETRESPPDFEFTDCAPLSVLAAELLDRGPEHCRQTRIAGRDKTNLELP